MILLKDKFPIWIICCFLLSSCQQYAYKNQLVSIMGIDKVEIEHAELIDEFGGWGEGKTIEIYMLSRSTIDSFLSKSDKRAAKKGRLFCKNWTTNLCDSQYHKLINSSLNYKGDEVMTVQLAGIEKILLKKGIYVSFYYNEADPGLSSEIQMFVLDTEDRKLYIIETVC